MSNPVGSVAVLDKGWVNVISTSMEGNKLLEFSRKYDVGLSDMILDMPRVHLEIKCPLFVQLNMSKFDFKTNIKRSKNMEAFVPTVDQIKAKDHETSLYILENIEKTTEALLMNPKTFSYSGCDTFMAQIICPISMYNQIMVSGSLRQWMYFANQKYLPSTIEPYRQVIEDLLVSYWHYLEGRIGVGK